MKVAHFIRLIVTSHSGISSKRVCGVIGWLVCLGIMIYCTVFNIQAPLMIDTVLWCCMGLLGIDSVTGIFYKKPFKNDKSIQ